MVKREKEVRQLKQAYANVLENKRMQIRFISGEAGSGKTVLSNMFLGEIEDTDPNTLIIPGFCNIRTEYSIPYQPFKELLKHLLQDVEQDESEQHKKLSKAAKLKDALLFSGKVLLEYAPDLVGTFVPGATLLSIVGKGLINRHEKTGANIEESKIIEQYVDAIRAISERYNLVLIIDNLQWIDTPSVNLLYQLITGLQDNPVLLIGIYRSTDINISIEGVKHPMQKLLTEIKIGHGNVFINLDQISTEERKVFINQMLDTEHNIYDTLFREKLFERTNGNPLFVFELINLLKEEGMIVRNNDGIWMNNANLVWNSYPVRIEGIIQERIGRLEDSLVEVLSHASVQGYNFIAQVLSKTMGEPERDLLMVLSKKLQKEHHLVYEGECVRSNKGIVSRFNFSNYIFQQYLYQELSMSQRMMLHSDIAGILEELFKDNLNEVSGDIARHYEMAGDYDKTLVFIKTAVRYMISISTFKEAAVLIKKAIGILEQHTIHTLHIPTEHLEFETLLCICYRYTKGWGDPELIQMYQNVKELSKSLNDFRFIDMILFGIWSIHLTRLELDKCLQLAYKNVSSSKSHGKVSAQKTVLIELANTLVWMGKLTEAEQALNEFADLNIQHPEIYESNEINIAFEMLLRYLIYQKLRDEEKLDPIRKQLIRTVEHSNDNTCKVIAVQALAWKACINNDKEDLCRFAPIFLELTNKFNLKFYQGFAYLFYGALTAYHDIEKGLAEINEGYRIICEHNQSEVSIMHSVHGYLVCKCYLKAQKYDQLKMIDKVIEVAEERNERLYLDNLYELKSKCECVIGNSDLVIKVK